MSNSNSTVDILDELQVTQSQETYPLAQPEVRQRSRGFEYLNHAKLAGLAFLLSISPITAMEDPWLTDRRHRGNIITVSIYQEMVGRRISRSEALAVARQILKQAEEERLFIAEREANQGIQWNDQ